MQRAQAALATAGELLQAGLESMPVIEQAKGIVMGSVPGDLGLPAGQGSQRATAS